VRRIQFRHLFSAALAVIVLMVLAGCETTTKTTSRSLPAYEAPMAKSDFQTVRTTAYTHTESDHLEYGRRNALGGRLYAASRPFQSASYIPRALPVDGGPRVSSGAGRSMASYLAPQKRKVTRWVKGKRGKKRRVTVTEYVRPTIGSAAADWSRWPTGTVFRVLSTGQIYKVDDYGWALAGRNTIDLYMASRKDMNTWGVRHEPMQILRWGNEFESRRVLAGRQSYKHARRMLLSLDGQHDAAAALR
jgi:3D (Asp-Asp-Asp) domain-containing protein